MLATSGANFKHQDSKSYINKWTNLSTVLFYQIQSVLSSVQQLLLNTNPFRYPKPP